MTRDMNTRGSYMRALLYIDVVMYDPRGAEPRALASTPGAPHMSTSTEHRTHDDHTHVHGGGCGHVAVPHGDHTDYVHDGHLHKVHDDHIDECASTGHNTHEGHDHQHGENCGHVAVPHEDHVDYVHDGHRHAAHEGHWDDH
ncbi:hypothetical protein GCM10023100_06510 [Actinocorallia cavernae]|uniref:Threonine dehydratase n=3 Tax=Actinomycetota TaxID=201174 RepID=A0ABP6A9L1_9ACTN